MEEYRVLLADDEEEIRVGISRKIDWPGLGFVLVGEAGNGEEALELAEEGVGECLDYRRYHMLDTLLWVKAYCCYRLDRREEGVRLYRQVYSLLLSTREMRRLQILREQVKELTGVDLGE